MLISESSKTESVSLESKHSSFGFHCGEKHLRRYIWNRWGGVGLVGNVSWETSGDQYHVARSVCERLSRVNSSERAVCQER